MGDGLSTSIWYDNWYYIGPFVNKFGDRIIHD
jgi:hypothetical protein